MKAKHEQWVVEMLEQGSVSYGSAELEVLAKYLMSSHAYSKDTPSYKLLKINDKIQKNALQSFKNYITMGLVSNLTIDEYMNKHPDPSFATQLTNIMSSQYQCLKSQGLDNEEIFTELWDFASGKQSDFSYRAAGLGILTYFFEKCEVFEK